MGQHVVSQNTPPGGNTPHGGLPLTGFDAGLAVIVGVGLACVGAAIRRASRRAPA